ncbi:hypothetical protein [Actinoplanes sp. G11-F43]|uniref:hypothetical protein n=1 Tax=Actinoplanes sp. G11-F43 TaxID=3424130 RepID=UPI003D33C7F9
MPAVTIEDLGAWLLKANGMTSGLAEWRRADRWCVRPGYRTRLMAAGQPVIFWVSGDRRRVTPGVWALGELTGRPAVSDGKLRVPLRLHWLDEEQRVHRDSLRADPGLTDLEVLRQPQAANPSFVTVKQAAVLRAHLPPAHRSLQRTFVQ